MRTGGGAGRSRRSYHRQRSDDRERLAERNMKAVEDMVAKHQAELDAKGSGATG